MQRNTAHPAALRSSASTPLLLPFLLLLLRGSIFEQSEEEVERQKALERELKAKYEKDLKAADLAKGIKSWDINPGEYFGEMPLLFSAARCGATYASRYEGCKLLAFPKPAFIAIFSNDRSLLAEVRIKLLRSSCGLNDIISNRRARPRFVSFLENESRGLSFGLMYYEAASQVPSPSHLGNGLSFSVHVPSQSMSHLTPYRTPPHPTPLHPITPITPLPSQFARLEPLGLKGASRAIAQTIFFEFLDERSPHFLDERLRSVSHAMPLAVQMDACVPPRLRSIHTQNSPRAQRGCPKWFRLIVDQLINCLIGSALSWLNG